MGWQSILILVVIGALAIFAIVRSVISKKNKKGCGGCSGCNVERCPSRVYEENKEEEPVTKDEQK